MTKKLPIVAIIGRPNVGKSTLFNAMLGERRSIVSDIAGTTRDSLMEKVQNLGSVPFWLVDTAGLTNFANETLEKEIQIQAEIALKNADLILWLVDGKTLLTPDDYAISKKLRTAQKKVIFCANKIDDGNQQRVYELSELGFGLPEVISAKNNFRFWELVELIEARLLELGFSPKTEEEEPESSVIKVAIIGRPNVGKSTFFNQIIGQKRSVVSEIAGTTRDSIDTELVLESGEKFIFIDTAGVRKRGKIEKDFEFWSFVRTNESIERSDVCILLLDSLDGVTHQDMILAGKILEAGKGVILGVNKFDLAREKSKKTESDDRELSEVPMWDEEISEIRNKYLRYLQKKISFLPWAPVLFFSGKTGQGVHKIFDSILGISTERKKRVATHELNLFVKDIYYGHVTPSVGTKQGKIKYASQVAINPPKFIFFVNNKEAFHFSYERYIENRIRQKYGFLGTPIKIELRDSMGKWDEMKGGQ